MKYWIAGFMCYALLFSTTNAANFGQITIAGNRTVEYEQMNEYAVVEGDILLGPVASLNHQGAVITPKVGGSRWPNGVIPYSIHEELPFRNKLAIYNAIDHWQKNSSLEFVELNSKNREAYKDYIAFIPGEGTTCDSFVGRHGGEQVIHLSPRCSTMTTVHEIGHALGLWHEQSRADRNSYIAIIWENIDEKHQYNFNQHLTDGKDFGEYDYQSIMHYGRYAFSKNGKETIIPLDSGVEIGQRNQLSEKDIAAIKAMYPES